MHIVIKKKVNLEFLGPEYKGAYLAFRSLPLADYEKIIDSLPQPNPRYLELLNKINDGYQPSDKEKQEFTVLQAGEKENNKQNFRRIIDSLKQYFLEGKFPDEKTGELGDITDADDLEGLDRDVALKCFNVFTGQDNDPKVEGQSTTSSTTESLTEVPPA